MCTKSTFSVVSCVFFGVKIRGFWPQIWPVFHDGKSPPLETWGRKKRLFLLQTTLKVNIWGHFLVIFLVIFFPGKFCAHGGPRDFPGPGGSPGRTPKTILKVNIWGFFPGRPGKTPWQNLQIFRRLKKFDALLNEHF